MRNYDEGKWKRLQARWDRSPIPRGFWESAGPGYTGECVDMARSLLPERLPHRRSLLSSILTSTSIIRIPLMARQPSFITASTQSLGPTGGDPASDSTWMATSQPGQRSRRSRCDSGLPLCNISPPGDPDPRTSE